MYAFFELLLQNALMHVPETYLHYPIFRLLHVYLFTYVCFCVPIPLRSTPWVSSSLNLNHICSWFTGLHWHLICVCAGHHHPYQHPWWHQQCNHGESLPKYVCISPDFAGMHACVFVLPCACKVCTLKMMQDLQFYDCYLCTFLNIRTGSTYHHVVIVEAHTIMLW